MAHVSLNYWARVAAFAPFAESLIYSNVSPSELDGDFGFIDVPNYLDPKDSKASKVKWACSAKILLRVSNQSTYKPTEIVVHQSFWFQVESNS